MLEGYQALALALCGVAYALGLLYAGLQTAFRFWVDHERKVARERAEGRDEAVFRAGVGATQRHSRGLAPRSESMLRLTGRELTVSVLSRSRLFFVSQNLVVAITLRLVWIGLTLADVAPSPAPGEETCRNYHTLVSACNRLSQLLFFTGYLAMVGFLATIVRSSNSRKRAQAGGLSAEDDLVAALAQSTTRRRPGETMVPLPDLSAQPGAQAGENGNLMEDRQGFQALFSLCSALMTPDVVQILMNLWVYVVISVLLIVQWFDCEKERFDTMDHAQTITIAFFFAILGLMYLRYGSSLMARLRAVQHPLRRQLTCNVLLITMVCAILFTTRGVLFMLDPLFGVRLTGTLAKVMYPWFFYLAPELVPGLLMLHLMTPRPRRTRLIADISSALLDGVDPLDEHDSGAEDELSASSAGSRSDFGSFSHQQRSQPSVIWV